MEGQSQTPPELVIKPKSKKARHQTKPTSSNLATSTNIDYQSINNNPDPGSYLYKCQPSFLLIYIESTDFQSQPGESSETISTNSEHSNFLAMVD